MLPLGRCMGVSSNGSRISFVAHACRLTLTSGVSDYVSKRCDIFAFGSECMRRSYLE